MAWNQISVTTDKSLAPEIADLFSEFGAVSVTYTDAEDEPVYEPALDQTVIWTHTRITALYELDVDPKLVEFFVKQQVSASDLQEWTLDYIEDQAWERAWMEHYKPMKFADSLWVCPTGQEQREMGTVCLTLDPGLAFGTGTHPTTALCLEWLASHDLRDKVVIDYGCGSGILAIAALLLGAKYAYAIDIDPQALSATHYNAEKNQVLDRLSFCLPEDFQAVKADVVVANILAYPLIDLATEVTQLVADQGSLVLSGILIEQSELVAKAYREAGLLVEAPVCQEDWCRLDASRS